MTNPPPCTCWLLVLLLAGCAVPSAVTPTTTDLPQLVANVGPLASANDAFDKRDWERAAIAYAERARDPSTPRDAVPLAEARLAECLYNLGLVRASTAIFRDLAAGDGEAARVSFRWLARISVELPAADLSGALTGFSASARGAALEDLKPAVRSRARFLLADQLRRTGQLEEAIAELEKVEGDARPKAQILIAIVHVQRRLSVPAAEHLQLAAQRALELGDRNEAMRLRDFAALLEAQLYFSAATISSDVASRKIVIDRKKLVHAQSLFNSIPSDRALYAPARWQGALAHAALGDLAGARARLDEVLALPDGYFPEAELLSADVYWRTGDKARAREALARFDERHAPVVTGLAALHDELTQGEDGEGRTVQLLARIHGSPGELPPAIARALRHELRDRALASHLEDLRRIEQERAAIERLSSELQASKAGSYARSACDSLLEEQRRWLHTTTLMRLARAREELSWFVEKSEQAKAFAKARGG